MDRHHSPAKFKHQIIIPIIKPLKDSMLAESFRPIMLQSCILKVLETAIKNRIEWDVESKNKLVYTQFAFRKCRAI